RWRKGNDSQAGGKSRTGGREFRHEGLMSRSRRPGCRKKNPRNPGSEDRRTRGRRSNLPERSGEGGLSFRLPTEFFFCFLPIEGFDPAGGKIRLGFSQFLLMPCGALEIVLIGGQVGP